MTEDRAAISLLLRTAERLHAYGTPAHRLERVVTAMGRHFRLRVQVFSTPTSIFLGVRRSDEPDDAEESVHLVRVEPGGVDLGKLVDLDELLEEIAAGRLTARQGIERLRELDERPARFSPAFMAFGHGLAAGTAALFFGGGPHGIALSFVLGAMVGSLEHLSARREGVATIFEPLAAFLAAAVSLIAGSLTDGLIDDRIVSLASIIVLVPGLSLTVAFIELATRHLASGTARLAGSSAVFLTIAFGAFAGRVAAVRVLGFTPANPARVSEAHGGLDWLASVPALAAGVAIASVGFAILFRVRRKELLWVLGGCASGFAAARSVAAIAAAEPARAAVEAAAISAFTGALAVGVFANAYARFAGRPATVPLVPGLIVLVPGSVGYRALSAFTEENAVGGVNSVFQMLLLAAALVGGLLTANAVLPPRRNL